MADVSEVEHFARLIEALDPWLGQVVIIGGWAHRLYRLHPMAQPLDYQPLGTFDTDIAIPLNLCAIGEKLRARLLERDFREELMGDAQPPAAHYRADNCTILRARIRFIGGIPAVSGKGRAFSFRTPRLLKPSNPIFPVVPGGGDRDDGFGRS